MTKKYTYVSDSFSDWLIDNDIDFENIVGEYGKETYSKQEGQWFYYAYEIETPEFCLVSRHKEFEYDNGDRTGEVDYLYKGSIKLAKKFIEQKLLEQEQLHKEFVA